MKTISTVGLAIAIGICAASCGNGKSTECNTASSSVRTTSTTTAPVVLTDTPVAPPAKNADSMNGTSSSGLAGGAVTRVHSSGHIMHGAEASAARPSAAANARNVAKDKAYAARAEAGMGADNTARSVTSQATNVPVDTGYNVGHKKRK